MNILITGGAGFIGSNLAEFFVQRGDSVRTFDNLSTGRLENLAAIQAAPNHQFIQASVADKAALAPHVQWADHVYHLAAPVGVKYIMDHPVITILDNIRGADNILELCHKHGKRILMASTSEVYGKSLDLLDPTGTRKLAEDDYRVEGSTRNHRWAYANTKSMDEFLSLAYHKEHNLDVVVVRFFNTVGPRQLSQYGMVIPNFVQRALAGEDLLIFGTGQQKRSFMHVKDVLRAVIGLMETGKGIGEVFNIGNPVEITIESLARQIIEMCGSKSQLKYMDYESYYGKGFEDMDRRTADISKLRSTLGFEIEYDLPTLLQDIISYHRARMAATPA